MDAPTLESPNRLRLGAGTYSTAQLDELIEALAVLRRQMDPPIPTRFGSVVGKLVEHDPDFIAGQTQHGHLLVAFRDAGLGWRAFELTAAYAIALRDALIKWAPRGGGPLASAGDSEH